MAYAAPRSISWDIDAERYIRKGYAKASETWLTGALLIRSSGQLAEAASNNVADVIGIACHPVTSATANDEVLYIPADAPVEFTAEFNNSSTETHTLAAADLYTNYGFTLDANGNWYVDYSDTTNDGAFVTGFVGAIGDVDSRCKFVFVADTLAKAT